MVLFEAGVLIFGRKVITNLIAETSSKIYCLLESSLVTVHPDVTRLFKELDLEVRLKVIKSLIENVNTNKKTIQICLEFLHKLMIDLNDNIDKINEIMKEHDEKYFKSWRSVNFEPYLTNIEDNSKLLQKRVELFLDILKVERNLK